jgi:hypothetical protein
MIHQELIAFMTIYYKYGEIDPTGSFWILGSRRIRFFLLDLGKLITNQVKR